MMIMMISYDLIQMPARELKNSEDKFSWRLLVISLQPNKTTTVIVGRHSTCDFRIDSPHLPCFLSRKHARLDLKENELLIQDLGSTNGTYKNNIKLSPKIQYSLKNGDFVAFGCKSELKPLSGQRVDLKNTPIRFRVQKTILNNLNSTKNTSQTSSDSNENIVKDGGKNTFSCAEPSIRIGHNSTPDENDSGFGDSEHHARFRKRRQSLSDGGAGFNLDETINFEKKRKLCHPQDQDDLHQKSTSSNWSSAIGISSSIGKEFPPDASDEPSCSSTKQESPVSGKRKLSLSKEKTHSYVLKKSTSKPTRSQQQFGRDKKQKDVEPCASSLCKMLEASCDDDLVDWVQCDFCDKWYHTVCAGCDYDDIRKRQFDCGCCDSP